MDYLGTFELGLIFSLFVLGMVISFRLLSFADLTIEGSFTTGGAVFATLINQGFGSLESMFLAMLAGGFAGFITASLHCFLAINKLISGIVVLTLLYSVNLHVMGRSNIFIDLPTLLNQNIDKWFEFSILLFCCIIVFFVIKLLLSTNFGLFIRATGENESFVKNQKVNPKIFILVGLTISNALIALSGCIFAQYIGYSDIGNGNGMLVSMLTAMIIGESIIRPVTLNRQIISAFFGAIIFQYIYAFTLEIGVDPIDLKIIIGVMLVLFLAASKLIQRGKATRNIGSNFI